MADLQPRDTIRLFCADLNWSRFDGPRKEVGPSAPQDWAFIDPDAYYDWHQEFGDNAIFCQAYTYSGYAFYPTRLGPVAPGPGSQLLPRLYERARREGVPFWSYFTTGADLATSAVRPSWVIPNSHRTWTPGGYLGPETPWTDLLCARIREFLSTYPVDWLLFDIFSYGPTQKRATFGVQPAWFVQEPFERIIGRPMPEKADDITPEETVHYKREVLAEQFGRIRGAVKETSPTTRILFNVPYWRAAEPVWADHPMVRESDGLFAECSRPEVIEWLLAVRRPDQRVMTTVVGGLDKGESDPVTATTWHSRGCDLFGYAWGTPPDFRPHRDYLPDVEAARLAFRQIECEERRRRASS